MHGLPARGGGACASGPTARRACSALARIPTSRLRWLANVVASHARPLRREPIQAINAKPTRPHAPQGSRRIAWRPRVFRSRVPSSTRRAIGTRVTWPFGRLAERAQFAGPVVRARARLHRHKAARRQLHAPGHELLALERPPHDPPARSIDRVNLNHALGQVCTYPHDPASCNLVHGLPLFSFRLKIATQSWCLDTVTGRWEVPSYSIERTHNGEALSSAP